MIFYQKTKIAIKPRKFCDKNCTKTNIGVEDNEIDPTVSLKFMTNVDNIDSVGTVVFNDIPACLVIVNSIRKIMWSDNKRGVIEVLDLDKITRNILVNKVTAARSISIDPNRGYLFWCNYALDGSIERIDLHGRNRIDITRGKYELNYPTGLTVDQYSKKLYWSCDNVTHTSDFNGNNHAVLPGETFLEENRPDCINFTEAKEHNIYWGKKSVGDHVPSVLANFLLSVTYVEKNDTSEANTFSKNDSETRNPTCSHSCIKNPEGYYCVCLNDHSETCRPKVLDYLLNNSLSSIGFQPINAERLPGFDYSLIESLGNAPFDYNLKTQKLYYYSMAFKQIRIVNMSLKSKIPTILLDKITIPSNGLAYDWITNNLYFIDCEEQNIKVLGLYNNNPRIILSSENNSTVNALAIHSQKSILFFIRKYSTKKIIYKMALVERNVSAITEINEATSNYMIIDPSKNIIFWLNFEKNTMEKIDFYGNNRETYSSPELYPFITKLNAHYILSNAWNDETITIKHFNLKEKRIEKIAYFGKIKKFIHKSDDEISEFLLCFVLPLCVFLATLTLYSFMRVEDN